MVIYNIVPSLQQKLREAVPLDRSKGAGDFADILGALCNNNNGFFALSTAITAGVTLAKVTMSDGTIFAAPAGVVAITTNATGAGTIFVSDGTYWQQYAVSGVTLTGIQTLTNKTLTAPAITAPTITGGASIDTLTLNGNKQPNTWTVEAVLPGATSATTTNYGPFFIAPIACQVVGVSEVHTAVGTAGTIDVEHLTGTQAPGSGVACLGATKVSMTGAINTVQSPALTGTAANLQLAAGDRLSLLQSGITGSPANVVVQVNLKAI